MIRIGRSNADQLNIHLVQLKGGGAGLTAAERGRIDAAVQLVQIGAALAMWDGGNMAVDFLAALPRRVDANARKAKGKRR